MRTNNQHLFFKLVFDHYHNEVRLLHFCDYLLFIFFSVLFLWGLQSNLLILICLRFLHVESSFTPFMLAVILTTLLTLVKNILNRFVRFKGKRHSISFIPSFILLVLLTNLVPGIDLSIIISVIAGLLIYIFFVYNGRGPKKGLFFSSGAIMSHSDNFFTLFFPNLLVMLCCFFFTVLFSNTNDIFHYELEIEHYIKKENYAGALKVAANEEETSTRLTALRALAMAKSSSLGEHLFEYPIIKGDSDLFLHPSDAENLIFPIDSARSLWGYLPNESQAYTLLKQHVTRKEWVTHKVLVDYWLCTLLLQKNLSAFTHYLPLYYNMKKVEKGGRLPKHYQEALILYQSLYTQPSIIYRNVETETNYSDFLDVINHYSNKQMRSNYTRRLYGNTYWWYYYFG